MVLDADERRGRGMDGSLLVPRTNANGSLNERDHEESKGFHRFFSLSFASSSNVLPRRRRNDPRRRGQGSEASERIGFVPHEIGTGFETSSDASKDEIDRALRRAPARGRNRTSRRRRRSFVGPSSTIRFDSDPPKVPNLSILCCDASESSVHVFPLVGRSHSSNRSCTIGPMVYVLVYTKVSSWSME